MDKEKKKSTEASEAQAPAADTEKTPVPEKDNKPEIDSEEKATEADNAAKASTEGTTPEADEKSEKTTTEGAASEKNAEKETPPPEVPAESRKGEAEIAMGSIRMRTAITNLQIVPQSPKKRTEPPKEKVKVVRKFTPSQPQMELNVIGMNVDEALVEVENFLDKAVMDNLEEVKIIHGAGTGRLRNAIAERLKKHRHVKEFRSGRYGEGEIGVTIVTLK